jgi:predicted transcriptional regulator
MARPMTPTSIKFDDDTRRKLVAAARKRKVKFGTFVREAALEIAKRELAA